MEMMQRHAAVISVIMMYHLLLSKPTLPHCHTQVLNTLPLTLPPALPSALTITTGTRTTVTTVTPGRPGAAVTVHMN